MSKKKKKERNATDSEFVIPQGSFDGKMVSELVNLNEIYIYIKIVHIVAHGLYQDDALIEMKDKKSDMIRKNLFKLLIDISCRSNLTKLT